MLSGIAEGLYGADRRIERFRCGYVGHWHIRLEDFESDDDMRERLGIHPGA